MVDPVAILLLEETADAVSWAVVLLLLQLLFKRSRGLANLNLEFASVTFHDGFLFTYEHATGDELECLLLQVLTFKIKEAK